MSLGYYIANQLFLGFSRRHYKGFLKACDNPEDEQTRQLFKILKRNYDTRFGREYGFGNMETVAAFQQHVPLSHYDEYIPKIKRIISGEKKVLTEGKVGNFALSSGSVAPSKFIPYTRTLKKEFSAAIYPWLYDLLKHHPKIRKGSQFWIISPATLPENLPEGAVPIGFEKDINYFGRLGKLLLRSVLTLPSVINQVKDRDNYFYLLCHTLLKDKDLSLISVWNPGLLIILLEYMAENYVSLSRDLTKGKISLPNPNIKKDARIASRLRVKSSKRGKHLLRLCEFSDRTYRFIWPNIRLISCWTDAWAGDLISGIRKVLPDVEIQGKGLMATEGVVSIPIKGMDYPVLCIRSHFYEFRNLNDDQIYLAHQLKENEKYEVIITSSGGFYRYMLDDIIEVKGFYNKTPLIRFIGKTNIISDTCGEKLHEVFVAELLQELIARYFKEKTYCYLAPVKINNRYSYVMTVETEEEISDVRKLQKEVDDGLKRNFHYKHCREMNQIGIPLIRILNPSAARNDQAARFGENPSGSRKFSYLHNKPIADTDFYVPIEGESET